MTAPVGFEVSLSHVTKRYASLVAVDDLSLDIEPGSVVAVTGPSGSGKSTLLHLIGAIERADSGRIEVGGQVVTGLTGRRLPRYRRGVGLVFQRFHLLPALTALDNVLAPLLPYRTGFDKVARVREVLAEVGLADRERSLPARLSGGQQQRVAVARALVHRPGLLLADEPTGNLDSGTGAEIVELLLRTRDRYGTTVLVATHSALVAARCERVLRLRDGALVDDRTVTGNGTPEQTLRRIEGLAV